MTHPSRHSAIANGTDGCVKPNRIPPEWKTILTHESGHAVAALVLYSEVADIRLRCSVPGEPADRASYNLPDIESGSIPNPRPALDRIMVYAAGAKAEEVLLGITHSEGFRSDRAKIEVVRQRLRRDADEAYLRSLGLPSESLSVALANVPEAKTRLALVELEISSGYSRTAELIDHHRREVELIASKAIELLQEVNHEDGVILLRADQVRLLWTDAQRGMHDH